jgi:hypothetical protein
MITEKFSLFLHFSQEKVILPGAIEYLDELVRRASFACDMAFSNKA